MGVKTALRIAAPVCGFGPDLEQITSQRLFDQSQAGMHIGKNATYPPVLGPFGCIHVPYLPGLNCLTPCKIIILSNKRIPQ